MATYNNHHSIQISDEIELLREQIKRDIFCGAEYPTEIILKNSTNAIIDEYTEEVSYVYDPITISVSGIIGRISESDQLLGGAGKTKIGDLSILYHYSSISGVYLHNNIDQVIILATAASGLYNVAGEVIESLANEPMFVKLALTLNDNGFIQ